MSSETAPSQANQYEKVELTPEVKEAIEKIKHPPAIDDAMMALDPAELLSNPAMAPQMLNEGEDLRDDLSRD